MEDELSAYSHIAINLMVSGVLIGIIALFSIVSYSMYNQYIRNDSLQAYMQDKSKFYYFDNKIVNGSDIVSLIEGNVRLYTFKIESSNGTFEISLKEESKLNGNGVRKGMSIWSDKYLVNTVLGSSIVSDFKASLITDEYKNAVIGVKFIEEG